MSEMSDNLNEVTALLKATRLQNIELGKLVNYWRAKAENLEAVIEHMKEIEKIMKDDAGYDEDIPF